MVDEDYDAFVPLSQAVAERRENDARELKLWGNLLPLKRVLQARGFGVWWSGKKINVGTKLLTVGEFKALAKRHMGEACPR